MAEAHKKVVEHLTQIVNSRHVHHLDQVFEENIKKKENSKIAFNNIQEAREYYSMEHEAHPNVRWKILDFEHNESNINVLKAQIEYNHHNYTTTYTFAPSGKIQTIESVLNQ